MVFLLREKSTANVSPLTMVMDCFAQKKPASIRGEHFNREKFTMQHELKIQAQAYSIQQFCDAHGISRGSFYNLQTEGLAPATMRVGKRVLISIEAAVEWRAKMSASTNS